MKTKIEIKSVSGSILFEFEKEENTIKDTVLEAIKNKINLSGADLHGVYLGEANMMRVDLSGADLNCAFLSDSNLCEANMRNVNLNCAYMSGTDMSFADLSNANLFCADLNGANLSSAKLINANLSGAGLSGANLGSADLNGANLCGTDYNISTAFLLSQCPSEGSFIGWKRCYSYIVKLLITENAKRSSNTTLQCRCSEAKVLEIQNMDGTKANIESVASEYDKDFIYNVGEISKVNFFNKNKWAIRSNGIHFFISREMAVKYN